MSFVENQPFLNYSDLWAYGRIFLNFFYDRRSKSSRRQFTVATFISPRKYIRFWGGVTNFFKGPLIRARDKDILHEAYMRLNLSANKNIELTNIICTFGGT